MTRDGSAWKSQAARIVAVLGHELRNPLAASAASLAAASAMTDAQDPRHAFLQQALADLERLASLLDGYLAFGCGRSSAQTEIDLRAVAQAVARRHGERLTVEAPRTPMTIRGDAPLLERVFENLIDNAIQAGATHVDISLRRDGSHAVAVVDDDGPGLPAELRERAFEPLVSGRDGTGVGLALAADVLRAHGGEISAAPSSRGARFRIVLPLLVADRELELTASALGGTTAP